METTFECPATDDELAILKDIRVESHCEHHIVPILGKAHIGYAPDGKIVRISKLARVVDIFAKRLQIQETLTAQIANTIESALKLRSVAVMVEAAHQRIAHEEYANRASAW